MLPDIPSIFRAVRNARGITQAELATELRVEQGTVSQYETGHANPSTDVLLLLLRAAPDGLPEGDAILGVLAKRFEGLKSSGTEFQKIRTDLMRSFSRSPDLMVPALKRVQNRAFIRQVEMLLDSKVHIDASVPELLRVYREHEGSPKIRELFRKVLGFLDVETMRASSSRKPAGAQSALKGKQPGR